MALIEWGAYHLVTPGWTSTSDEAGHAVKGTHRYGPSQAETAIELSRIIGDDARARGIEQLLELAAEREDPVLNSAEIGAFRAQLAGLESNVRAAILDDRGRIRTEVLPDLRQRARCMDLDQSRGEDALWAGLEALSRVQALDDMLASAIASGLHVLLD